MEPSDLGETAFAVVYDIAASWQDYHLVREAGLQDSVPGLILHAAGPTQDGFRTIDVWASEGAWEAYRPRLRHVFDHLAEPPVVRELHIGHLTSALLRPVAPGVTG
ncbi:MAG: hypothetical protein H0T54_05825 [Geodermatophilaceae bacterium]|nr:hypothetical protein [Geodermatophilaceae bacterium]